MHGLKSGLNTALGLLFLAALGGLALRLAFVVELPIDYQHLKQAHGRLAMLGWVHPAFLVLISAFFHELRSRKLYGVCLWGSMLSALAMAIAFYFQGYGVWSLGFFAVHVLLVYPYVVTVFSDLKGSNNPSGTLLKGGLIFLALSTFGFWAAAIMELTESGGRLGEHMAAQFFLHFQLTGWFTFAALALFFRIIEKEEAIISSRKFRSFFWGLSIATVLTFALAVAWLSSHPLSYALNGLGVGVQLAAFIPFLSLIRANKGILKRFSLPVRGLFIVAFLAFALRVLIQSGLVIPEVAEMAHTINELVIGFIHLNVLGLVSPFLFGVAIERGLLSNGKWSGSGLLLFLAGVLLTELLLFLQGLFFWLELGFLPSYYETLLFASILLPLGIGLLLFSGRVRPSDPSRI